MSLYMHAPAFESRSLRYRLYSDDQPRHGQHVLVRIGEAQFEAIHAVLKDGCVWALPRAGTAFLCQPTDTWRPEDSR